MNVDPITVPWPPFELRPMLTDDITNALRIERQCSSQPWTEGIFRDELREPSRSYTVATFGELVVGFCGLMINLEEGHITNIATDPSHRRNGIATMLLLQATRTAIARSVNAMTLEVRVSNTAARKLYARFGYAPAGVRPKYYADNSEDALILWAHDVDTAEYGVRLAGISSQLAALHAANSSSAPPRLGGVR